MKPLLRLFGYVATLATILLGCTSGNEQSDTSTESRKSVLLHQLKTTHNIKEWFVPVNDAVAGITAEQAAWKDSVSNHSVGQLVYHLAFWNKNALADFFDQERDEPESNDETFDNFTAEEWNQTVTRLDSILTEMEKFVEAANEEQLDKWASTIANVSTHNAYHTGQIIYVRKQQGSWDPDQGVKF